jgi:hypothetical protein
MLSAREFAKQLLATADGRISVAEFEEWFELNSWNIHKQLDQGLIDAVFHVEELFSAYSDRRAEESGLRRALAEIARELLSDEAALSKIPFVLGETEDASVTFAFTGEIVENQEAPDWFPVAGPVHEEELAFGA